MFVRWLPLLAVVSASSGQHPIEYSDADVVIDDLLTHVNSYINRRGLSVIKLPKATMDGWFIKRTFHSGSLKDLSTITRKGNATLVASDSGDTKHYAIQSSIGLGSLSIGSDYDLSTLFGLLNYHGHVSISAKSNLVDVEVTIITVQNGGTCTVVIDNLAVLQLDDFEVDISNAGLMKPLLSSVTGYLLKYVVPMMKQGINNGLHNFIRSYPVNPEVTQYICKYFEDPL